MADNGSNTGVFAQHYRTGKYADLTLVAKDGTLFNVHRLVVCPLSPVLDAQAADGAKSINTDEDVTTIGQMIEWMYGIDDKKLLIEGKSVDEVKGMGPSVVCGEIVTLSSLAKVAEKYQLPKLKNQVTELIDELTKNLSSIGCILEAVLQLAPEGVLGNVQKTLILCASKEVQDRQVDMISHLHKVNKNLTPVPLLSNMDASHNGENEANINRSALRSAKTPIRSTQTDDEDSDVPLSQSKKRKKQESHRSVEEPNTKTQPPSFAREMNLKYSPVRKPSAARPTQLQELGNYTSSPSQAGSQHRQKPQERHVSEKRDGHDRRSLPEHQTDKESLKNLHEAEKRHPVLGSLPDSISARQVAFAEQIRKRMETQSAANKLPQTRRNEPFRISTALPENIPPQGPHCYCKVAESDITLLPCADCGRRFHPRCVGKGKFAKGTYAGGDTKGYMLKDLDAFVDKKFKCGDCEAGYFGRR